MKQDWHHYEEHIKRAEIAIRKAPMSATNRDLIFRFERELSVKGLSLARLLKYVDSLKRIGVWLKKDFDKTTKDDLLTLVERIERQKYSVWTKTSYRIIIKRFFKWVCKTEDGYPDIVRWIATNCKASNVEKVSKSQILTENDLAQLLRHAHCARDKALVSVLWESGCRIGELATLHIKDLQFDEHGVVLQVIGKTGSRQVRIINASAHLASWLNEHPYRNQPDKPVWINTGTVHRNAQLNYAALRQMLKRLFHKAGIQKPSNPHIFRHSRATFMASYLTEFQMNHYFGWVQGSGMPATYVHLSGKDLDSALLNMNGMAAPKTTPESCLKPQTCPKCSMLNSHDNKFCQRCGGILDMTTLARLEEERRLIEEKRQFADNLMNQLMTDPQIQAMMKAKLASAALTHT